jgi:hypothetical protein
MKTLKSQYSELRKLGDYIRLPTAAAEAAGIEQVSETSFGCSARLQAISEFLQPKHCDLAVDLGANCAFFCLSLLHEKIIKRARVVEKAPELIEFGRLVAEEMGLADSVSFEEVGIDLPWLDQMPPCDVVICQNLLHHAGYLFDVDRVAQDGWDAYAVKFLRALRAKAKYGVISINMEPGRPVNWTGVKDVREDKAARFAEILTEAGWSICRQTEVFELVKSRAARSQGGTVADLRGPSKWLLNRGVRSTMTRGSIWLSRIIGKSGLGECVRGWPIFAAYKKALDDTRVIRSDHYYLYLLE